MSYWSVRKADPKLFFARSNIRKEYARKLLAFSRYSFLGSLGDQLRFFVDSIVIGRVLNLAMITPFSIAARIVTMFRMLMAALGLPLASRVSELEGQNRQEELRKYFLLATRLCSLMSFFFVLLWLLNGRAIIRLWIGEPYAQRVFPLLAVLLAGDALMLAQSPAVDLLLAKGNHRLRGWWTMAEGLANLGLSVYWAGSTD